jgi:hypothetical protein
MFALGVALIVAFVRPAAAWQEEIRIGATYPLTGAAALTGSS